MADLLICNRESFRNMDRASKTDHSGLPNNMLRKSYVKKYIYKILE